jgi:hypothetical protein
MNNAKDRLGAPNSIRVCFREGLHRIIRGGRGRGGSGGGVASARAHVRHIQRGGWEGGVKLPSILSNQAEILQGCSGMYGEKNNFLGEESCIGHFDRRGMIKVKFL